MDISKFTRDAQKAAFCAQRLAGKYGHAHITPEHVLLALAMQTDNFVEVLFDQIDGDLAVLIEQLDASLTQQAKSTENGKSPDIDESTQSVLNSAAAEAEQLHDGYICTEHVLLALFNVESIAEMLADMSINKELVIRNLDRVRCARTPKPGWLA